MRVIIAARLSQESDSETGLESQTKEATRFADLREYEVVATVADHKSGTVPPWDRPNLRQWVTDPAKLAQYDAVLAYRLDRLSRGDNASTNAIEDWANREHKQLLTADGLVFPCEGNDGIRWDVAKRIAHQEWLEASERYKRMHRTLWAGGFWVGKPPYGFQLIPADTDPKHMWIVIDDDEAAVIAEAAKRYLDGETLEAICKDFDTRYPTPTAGQKRAAKTWNVKTLSFILRNPAIHGKLDNRYLGPKVRPIISIDDFKRLDARMASRAHRKGVPPSGSALLTSVAFCPAGHKMYRVSGGYGKNRKPYYYCRECPKGHRAMVPLDLLDEAVTETIEWRGWMPYREIRPVPADSHQDQIDQAMAELANLPNRYDPLSDEYDQAHRIIRQQIKDLRALPVEPARTDLVDTGQTIGQHWASLDEDGRRRMLIDAGVKLQAIIVDGTLILEWLSFGSLSDI